MKKREVRRTALLDLLKQDPFCTDDELAAKFEVSVQTIRLDRMVLGIPEVRERMRALAEEKHQVIALDMAEVIGEILEMVPETSGSSLLEIGAEHVFQRTQIARGHHIFAQANSLAVAMIPFDVVLTRSAE
ncbi:MAG: fatty acid biosynthesis transcriptional regulator, partial [Bacilli bacterium]|nr:fatty acid biosynthesis transcriptional regulator [Bacilli bacterium]